jgi:N utilization substance protein B
MTLPRQKFREAIFLALFGLDSGGDEEGLGPVLMHELRITKKHVKEAITLAREILSLTATFDKRIASASTAYDFERIGRVEKNILRLGLFEMALLPPPVAISEALRLAKKFAAPESTSFINAILDNLLKHASQQTPI